MAKGEVKVSFCPLSVQPQELVASSMKNILAS